MLQVAIIEDDADVREALQEYLDAQADVRCCLVAASMEEALSVLPAMAAPDLILTDINLPGMSGLEGMPLLRTHCPEADIVMLTVYHDAPRIFQALCAGATGYLVKSTPLAEIVQSLHRVHAGGSVMSPAVARHVVEHFQPAPPAHRGAPQVVLSEREQQVVDGLAQGLSHKLMADRLHVSIDTVRYHFKNIYRKLHINSQTELLAKVLRREI